MWHFKLSYPFLVVLVLMFYSCAEKEIIIPPLEVATTGKNVLVEDLTGVRCPNCPSANARLEAIKAIYGDNLIIVSVHGNLLTRPLAESTQDFRSPAASALEESYAPLIGKPSAVINRKIHPEFSQITNPLQDQWQPIIERELQLPQEFILEADIQKEQEDYKVNIGVVPLEDYSGELLIHLLIVENGIIDAQEDVDRVILDYRHDHVLRDIITPLEGMTLANNFEARQVANTSLNIPVERILSQWNTDELDIIIIIANEEGEVQEVISRQLIE